MKALLLGLSACLLVACAGDEGVVFLLETNAPADAYDRVVITLTASATPDPDVCRPVVSDLEEPLPTSLAVFRGSTYRSWVALRVQLLNGGVERARREASADFEDGEIVERTVELSARCLDFACEAPAQCLLRDGEPVCGNPQEPERVEALDAADGPACER